MLSQQSQAIADGLHPITASNIVLFFHPSFSSLISISVESWGSLDIRSPGTFGAIRYYMFGHKFSMKYRSLSPHVYVNAFRELSCHKCGSTSACVGSSLCFYNSLSLSARVVKRRVRYERLGQVLPGCTILCTKAKDVQVWGTLYAVFCGKCLETATGTVKKIARRVGLPDGRVIDI
uniref:Uncharacterized protein n=1 Tax=Hyaloperonospora arabidopsidis (strain Emoy2) TaxID=559515 RepID=M4BYC6_HYAAE